MLSITVMAACAVLGVIMEALSVVSKGVPTNLVAMSVLKLGGLWLTTSLAYVSIDALDERRQRDIYGQGGFALIGATFGILGFQCFMGIAAWSLLGVDVILNLIAWSIYSSGAQSGLVRLTMLLQAGLPMEVVRHAISLATDSDNPRPRHAVTTLQLELNEEEKKARSQT